MGVLGAGEGGLEGSWGPWGVLEGLGGSWGGLGGVLGGSWAVLGRVGGPGRIFDRKSWFVGPSLAPLGGPSWAPKSIKIDKKSIPKCMQILHPFWDRFLSYFWSILAPKMDPKWKPNSKCSGIGF